MPAEEPVTTATPLEAGRSCMSVICVFLFLRLIVSDSDRYGSCNSDTGFVAVDVGQDANIAPLCIFCCARRFRLAGVMEGVAAQQEQFRRQDGRIWQASE